ncbi:MAG: hypothetical protein KJ939_04555 [Nanoarchaeota archaeon]|nr:hypothetical protein [Nanoarchaeota archaeon]MBU4352327.1 hypothetical protein [Nanoarchaeota archaeon]
MKKRIDFFTVVMDELFDVERKVLWLIIPLFVLFLLTGYSITRLVIIPKSISLYLHFTVCSFLAALILIHVLGRARNALARVEIKGKFIDLLLLVIGVVILILLLYMEFK